jgi:hypothetical protein
VIFNKLKKIVHQGGVTMETYHDARSNEHQIYLVYVNLCSYLVNKCLCSLVTATLALGRRGGGASVGFKLT